MRSRATSAQSATRPAARSAPPTVRPFSPPCLVPVPNATSDHLRCLGGQPDWLTHTTEGRGVKVALTAQLKWTRDGGLFAVEVGGNTHSDLLDHPPARPVDQLVVNAVLHLAAPDDAGLVKHAEMPRCVLIRGPELGCEALHARAANVEHLHQANPSGLGDDRQPGGYRLDCLLGQRRAPPWALPCLARCLLIYTLGHGPLLNRAPR